MKRSGGDQEALGEGARHGDHHRLPRREAEAGGLALQVTLQTSPDPVGAPIFYRDVPLIMVQGSGA